jgi:altronate hydrolase
MSAITEPILTEARATIRLHVQDDVVITTRQLVSGNWIPEENLSVTGLIPPGHKMAVRDLNVADPVRRYGQIIGFASQPIRRGQHVHVHNLTMSAFERDALATATIDATETLMTESPAIFLGILRPDGRVATRNYIGILTSVNCSATVARSIADRFRRDIFPDALAAYPNIDGVVALTHSAGCAVDADGEGLHILRRTLAGYARHPNFAAVLMVGLGCETNQIPAWIKAEGLELGGNLQAFTIQDTGGTATAVEHGAQAVMNMLADANRIERVPLPASHLVVGLQCGGSDTFSGITANPALGAAMDRLVRHGGTAILSETPEIYGAEHLLTRRAQNHEVANKLLKRIRWWEDYCDRMGADMNNNPSAGNKAGGLTTILEKSLGAVAKGGSTNLVDVLEYACPVSQSGGLVFMDTPGYDPVSATGQVAGGANLICFTTGRGSAYGCAPTPSIKLATNSQLWQRQQADMDINCGGIVDGDITVEQMGEEIFQAILRIASGERTKSEIHGYGQNEFVPWQLGTVT